MEAIVEFLRTLTDDPTTLRLLVIALAAGAVTVFGLGIAFLVMNATDPIRRRLKGLNTLDVGAEENGRRLVNLDTMLGPIAKYVMPSRETVTSETTKKLIYAGFTGPSALQNYYAIRSVLMVLLPAVFLGISQFFPTLPVNLIVLYCSCAAGLGFIGPSFALDRFLNRRQRSLRNGFPDALDLLVVCIESGLSLTQSIQRVADELQVSHPELAVELALVNAEMRAGVENVTALKNLGDRTGLEDIRGLVSTLVQTLRFGTSVADALRIYSAEFRDKRTQLAEEKAAKMGTKMIFPLVLFMFPGFFVIAIGPAVIRLMEAFGNM